MNYEKAYKELKEFCESLYDGVYCNNCGSNRIDDCEDCHRKMMGWKFPKSVIEKIEEEYK